MIRHLLRPRFGPIGIDVGTRSLKMVQLTADRSELVDASRVEWNTGDGDDLSDSERADLIIAAIGRAREGHSFRGSGAVMCLGRDQLFLQSIRLPRSDHQQFAAAVRQEAAKRLPFPIEEAEIRFFEAADVRHGEEQLQEVILLACHRPLLVQHIEMLSRGGLRPLAVDVEPAAILRTFGSQHRRECDQDACSLVVDLGYQSSVAVIAQGSEILFIKYLDVGGKHFDEAVARSLRMAVPDAISLRRQSGDRRSDRQDPEIAGSVADATRPVIERLVAELSKCIRYHSVTFRGQKLTQIGLGGGEADAKLGEFLQSRLGLPCEVSDPFRVYPKSTNHGRGGQWDVATGLAMRSLN